MDDFNELVNIALNNRSENIRPVIAKEILHYDILYALNKENLLDNLTFQGGTSLRLCYGSQRLSEDLDFTGGDSFNLDSLNTLKDCVMDYIGKKYGLDVFIKTPNELVEEHIKIAKWQISVVTAKKRPDIPRQRIKLEVANISSLTKNLMPLKVNYDFLTDGVSNLFIGVQSMQEIMSDKVVSFIASKPYIRYRDIWDLCWLDQRQIAPDILMVRKKINQYQITDYENSLNQKLNQLEDIVKSTEFFNEMRRFIPQDVWAQTLNKKEFQKYLFERLTLIFSAVHTDLYKNNNSVKFKM